MNMEVAGNNQEERGRRVWRVQAGVQSRLDSWVSDYLGGLELTGKEDGTSWLEGELPDLAAVYGMVLGLRDLGVELHFLTVQRAINKEEVEI